MAGISPEECAAAKLIVGDITYLPIRGGRWYYLAVWQDKKLEDESTEQVLKDLDSINLRLLKFRKTEIES